MKTSPHPAIDLPANLFRQLVYTLTGLLPPPLDDSPAALGARNHAAIAKVAALLPVNANEIDIAAQCVAARAQAEDVLRLLRRNAGDIGLVMRLNAQYALMARTSISMQGCLMRVQAARHKREATEGAASGDAWAAHVAERSMLEVPCPSTGPGQPPPPEAAPATQPEAAPAVPPELDAPALLAAMQAASPGPAQPTWLAAALAAPTEAAQAASPEAEQATLSAGAPAADTVQGTSEHVPENATKSQDMAFETWMIAQLQALVSEQPDADKLSEVVRAVMAQGDAQGQMS